MTIPFNMNYSINNSLREVPENEHDFTQGLSFLENAIRDSKGFERVKLLSKLGGFQRIIGELNQSLKFLTEAKNLLETFPDSRLSVINQLRLAQTYQFKDEHLRASEILDDLEIKAKSNPDTIDLLDFIYQHQGKNQFDQQHYETALSYFQKALDLRKRKGEQELIQSTILALEVTKNRILQ